jgi:mono/diheme cytochrome c family protein
LSDVEVAAVASYVRDAWGNGAPPVGEELVRSKR